MFIRCRFICLFALLINKVSLQVTIEAVISGAAVLPCSSAERDLKLEEIDVFWRDKDNKIIYNLIKGKAFLDTQDSRYKNRVKSFSDEYKRGNFSIELLNLTQADTGTFICFITPLNERETVELIINEISQNSTTGQKENHGQETHLSWWQILLICVFILLPLLILATVCYTCKHRKRNQSYIEGAVVN